MRREQTDGLLFAPVATRVATAADGPDVEQDSPGALFHVRPKILLA